MAFFDDFNRADSAGLGNGWAEQSDIYEILGNQVRASAGGTNWQNCCVRPSSESWENGTVEVEFTVVSAFQTYPRVEARWTTPGGTPQYYMAIAYQTSVRVAKYQGGSFTTLATQSISSLSVGTKYRLTLILNGADLMAEIRNASTGTLIGSANVTNTSITGSGRQGFAHSASAAGATDFDNFSALPQIDATRSITDDGAGNDSVAAADTSGAKSLIDSGSGMESIGISAAAPVADAAQGADSVSIAVFLGLIDTGVGADFPSVVEPAMLALLERFDGTLDNWTLDTSGGTAQIQTVDFDEKLVLNDTSGSALVSATRSIEGQSAPFCIETDIYVATGAIGLLEALDSGGNVVFSIKADAGAGQGTFDTDDDTPSTFSLTAAKYYQIVFYCDPLALTVRAWQITGTGTAPSVWTAIGAAKNYSGALVTKIRLTTDATATGEARFDEVKVFRPGVFCIGDSNTAGYKSSAPTWNPVPSASQRLGSSEDETHSYPHWLGLRFDPVQWAANRGINADKSADVDGRIQGDVIDQGAQTVAILIGTNDITAGVALATIEANIQSAAGKAATAGLTVCLCSVPPRNAWDSGQNTKRDDLNAWIAGHCTANGYKFADVYTAVKNPSNPNQLHPDYDAGDGLHFTTAGLQVIADTVYGALIETKTVNDAGAGVDAVEVTNIIALTDSCAALEGTDISNFLVLTDSCAASDTFDIHAAVALLEMASCVEGLTAEGDWQEKPVADSAFGTDFVSVTIKEGVTLQDIYDLTLTRLSSSAYVAPDNAGIAANGAAIAAMQGDVTSLITYAVAMSKWKNNKLARTSVTGRVETWVLYDDDGTTPLLTWTHDATARTRGKAY